MIIIEVSGKPAPQGSKTRNRAGAIYESSKAVGPWRDAVRAETQRALFAARDDAAGTYINDAGYLNDDPVEVSILVRLPRPAGHYGSGRNARALRASAPARPAVTPDIDKLSRSILDGITAGGAIADDKQITDLRVSKVYCGPGEAPGCSIRIELATVSPVVERRRLYANDIEVNRTLGGAIGDPLPALRLEQRESLERSAELLHRINGR